MKKALEVLNGLVSDGVLKGYAIGGAMGATFYLEPVVTMDLDVFVVFPKEELIASLEPIYTALQSRGYKPDACEHECVDIAGTPVQFLPAFNPLLVEACEAARPFVYEGIQTKVLPAEYLAAISLQTGRPKDKLRVQAFADAGILEKDSFGRILKRFGLTARWDAWTAKK
jgi:hypothetical protein